MPCTCCCLAGQNCAGLHKARAGCLLSVPLGHATAAQALCTEASLHALRRRYPQIYDSDDKLLIDPASIAVEQQDFVAALSSITPASHRSAAAHARCHTALTCFKDPQQLLDAARP